MTTTTAPATTPASTAPDPAPRRPAVRPTEPEDRGSLTISGRAVEAIAARALAELDEIGGAARRVLGLALGSDGEDSRPRVSATVSGRSVAIEATIAVDYPRPVVATVDHARDHLVERIDTLTGLTVSRIDVTVGALTAPDRPGTRRELT